MADEKHEVTRRIEKGLDDLLGGTWKVGYGADRLDQAALAARYDRNQSGRWVVTGVLLLGDVITADMLRAVPMESLEKSMNLSMNPHLLDQARQLPPLRRERGMPPEEFSKLFAEHFKAWAQISARPIASLSREYGIKVTTLRTWLREARLRGLLPPGKRGKTR